MKTPATLHPYSVRTKNKICFQPVLIRGWVFLGLLSLSIPPSLSQEDEHPCGVGIVPTVPDDDTRGADCSKASSTYIDSYRRPGYWRWVDDLYTPPKTILVNYIICRNSSGLNGWENSPAMLADLQALMDDVSLMYSSSDWRLYPSTCQPSIPYIFDSRIRFELNQVIFIDDSRFNEAYHPSYSNDPATKATAEEILTWLWANHPETKGAMNHILTSPDWDDGVGYQGYESTFNGHNYVHSINLMLGSYPGYADDWPMCMRHSAHEYGHSLGLHHTYDGSEPRQISHFDFLDDMWGTCPEPVVMDPMNPCYSGGGSPCVPSPGYVCYLTYGCFFHLYPPAYPLMCGAEDNTYISPKMAGRFHRNLSLFNTSFVLNTQPMHQYVKEKTSWLFPLVVASDETWDFAIKMYQDIVVESGATLTIKCEVRMPIDGKIVVKPGAKLVVDGGVVTCAHEGEFWQHVEVWGDNTHNQSGTPIPDHQGMVVLKNGAIIEHARDAIMLQKFGVASTSGGVLIATDAHFINCTRSAQFLSYENTSSGGAPIANRSAFTRCEFKVDDEYRGGDDFYAHVSLWEVSGLRFNQCDFINAQTLGGLITKSDQLGYGIISTDANFTVNGHCDVTYPCNPGEVIPECPPGDLHPSRFIGLDHGIHAVTYGGSKTFTVMNSSFENNVCGVYANGVNNFSVLRNSFSMGDRDVDLTTDAGEGDWLEHHRAIYSAFGTGFRIEENQMTRAAGPDPLLEVEGVVIGYTGPINCRVYNNRSTGLNHAYVGEGTCLDYINDPTGTGLDFICNLNTDNAARDLVVRAPTAGGVNCIKTFQGSADVSAANTFSPTQNDPTFQYFNFDNVPLYQAILYFYKDNPLNPGSYNGPYVSPYLADAEDDCVSRIVCGGGHVLRSALGPEIDEATENYNSLNYVFESLVDGGNFDALQTAIMGSWPGDAWELRNTLMAHSPFLSEEILRDAASRNILPDAMMLELCLANPEATQQHEFTKWIEEAAPNPLPHYMVQQIIASWNTHTWRTTLQAAVGYWKGKRDQLNDAVITALLNDTVPEPLDSILVRIRLNNSLGARFNEAMLLYEMGDVSGAGDLLEGLEVDYSLDTYTAEGKDDLLALISLYAGADAIGQSKLDLNNAQLAQLEAIADGAPTKAGNIARNLLCIGYGTCYQDVTGSTDPTRMMAYGANAAGTDAEKLFHAFPSPASSWVTAEHWMTAPIDHACIVVRDIAGRELHRIPIAASPGQVLWDIRMEAPGTYSLELMNGGTLVAAARVIVEP